MLALPLCQIRVESGAWVPTENGVDVAAEARVYVRLQDPTNVREWYLSVLGTDESMPFPVVYGTDAITHRVSGVTSDPWFTSGPTGSAIIFESTVISTNAETVTASFGVYVPTPYGLRVGATGERVEGNTIHGWTTKVNPLIRGWSPPKPVQANGIFVEYACSGSVQVCDTVYLAGAEYVEQASAATVDTSPAVGLVIAKPEPLIARVLLQGEASGFSGLGVGQTYYLAAANGGITADYPSGSGQVIQTVAVAASTTKLLWNPTPNFFVLS